MSRKPVYSIYGLYREDNTIFDDMSLPTSMNKENVVGNILLSCEGLSVLYTDPAFMKEAIKVWSYKMLEKWTKLAETLALEYDPLENYRRNEVYSGDASRSENNSSNLTGARNSSEAQTDNREDETRDNSTLLEQGENLNSVNGMNSPTTQSMTAHDKSESSKSGASTNSGSLSSTGSSNRSGLENTATNSEESRSASNTDSHSSVVWGNAGTTMSQTMLQLELDIRSRWVLTDVIVNDFRNQFCLLVY